MRTQRRTRFRVEVVAAAVAFAVAALTSAWPDWIEAVFDVDPDRGAGWAEWLVVAVFLLAALSLGVAARHEGRRATSRAVGSTG